MIHVIHVASIMVIAPQVVASEPLWPIPVGLESAMTIKEQVLARESRTSPELQTGGMAPL